jgi:formamidopyrimidine-DNA glycosylase
MPELPEVEVLRRSLEPYLVGEEVRRIEVRSPALREPLDAAELERRLAGHRIERLGRRAKYLLVDVDGGSTLAVHLGMSGRLTLAPGEAPPERHEHLVIHLASGRKLRLRDPRRFGLAFALATAGVAADGHFAHLGIEPLSEAFSGAALRAAARGRRGPVKTFLMDARTVVGVGNIYACEALFRAGIHPSRSVARISEARWDRLAAAVVAVLSDAISEGGTTLNDFRNGAGESGYFQVSLAVYGREAEPCPTCSAPIRRLVHSNRSTFYCPRCQR